MANKFIFWSVFLTLGIIVWGCYPQTKKNDLIVIDELTSNGVKINYYIGCDSKKVFHLINANNIKLDVVDSMYVFIIDQLEFERLANALRFDDPKENLNQDSIAAIQPRVIIARSYNDTGSVSQSYSVDSFSKKITKEWGISYEELSNEAKRLIDRLRKHAFI